MLLRGEANPSPPKDDLVSLPPSPPPYDDLVSAPPGPPPYEDLVSLPTFKGMVDGSAPSWPSQGFLGEFPHVLSPENLDEACNFVDISSGCLEYVVGIDPSPTAPPAPPSSSAPLEDPASPPMLFTTVGRALLGPAIGMLFIKFGCALLKLARPEHACIAFC